jgi:hypothetical protein
MGSQSRASLSFAVGLSFAISVLAIGLGASAEECDYRTCGALMARDGSLSWAVSGRRDYSPDTKRACAELNACVRRRQKQLGRTGSGRTRGRLKLIEIGFSHGLKTRTRRQTGQRHATTLEKRGS